MDVLYKGQILDLKKYFDKPCLFIKYPSQIDMPKMRFAGGYPDEYCIYISDLTENEKSSITDLNGRRIDLNSVFSVGE